MSLIAFEIGAGRGPEFPIQVVQPKPTRFETELVEVGLQAGFFEIGGNHLASWRQRGFDPRLDGQTLLGGIACEETCADQNARVRCIGAARDRGNRHVAMADVVVGALNGNAFADLGSFPVLGFHRCGKASFDVAERLTAFRAFRSGHRWHDFGKVEFECVGEDRLAAGFAEHALSLGVSVNERDAVFGATRDLQVVERFAIDGEEAAGRTVFGRHVGDRRAVGQRHVVETRPEELDELADDTLLAQHLRDGENEVGRGHAFVELAGQAETDDFWQQHRNRLAQHGGFRFDTTDAPAQNSKAVDHRRVTVGANQRIGISDGFAINVFGPDGLGEVFEVHLVADAGTWRDNAEVVERPLAPLEEVIALAVALVFVLDVLRERLWRPEFVDNHRVVDDQIDRDERVDETRVAAELLHAIAHRGEVNDGRNAGEVLHQNARRAITDFAAGLAFVLQPRCNGLNIGLLDGAVVFEAQKVL